MTTLPLMKLAVLMCMSVLLVTAQLKTETMLAFSMEDSYDPLPTESSSCPHPPGDHNRKHNSEETIIFCRKSQKRSVWEYSLHHPHNLHMRPQLVPESSVFSQKSSQQSASPPLYTSRLGETINIEVTSLVDSAANASTCSSIALQQAPGGCNYRSAAAYCKEFLTEPTKYCIINFPPFETIVMDPLLGDITMESVTGNLLLYGNGCTLEQMERSQSTAAMQLLVITSSLTDEIHLTLTNMTVTRFNHVQLPNQGGVVGGAFHFTSLASAQFLHVTCVENSASMAGCLVFHGGNNIVVEDCTFLNNRANQQGGALMFSDHTTSGRMTRCLFQGNTAKTGGAVILVVANQNIKFEYCVFESNTATLMGGAVTQSYNNEVTRFTDCTFQSNAAVLDGGAIYMFSNNTDTLITGTLFVDNQAAQGGAVYAGERNSEFRTRKCSFISNRANYGGAIYFYVNNFNSDLEDTLFESNRAQIHGGAFFLYSNNNLGQFDGLNFTNNKADSNGGAIYLDFSNDLAWFAQCTFTGNEAIVGSGGAIFSSCKNTNLGLSATFYNNKAFRNGGAVAMISGNLLNVIRESSFERNSAGGAGGAIHSSLQNSGLMITRSFLWENNAPTMGGAVYVGDDHDNMTLSNVEIRHCHAQDGGGVYIGQRNTRITVVNASIFQNEAFGRGGGILSFAASIRMINSIFRDNHAGEAGGGVILAGTNAVDIENTYFEANNASTFGGLKINGHESVMIANTVINYNHATTSFGGGLSILNGESISFVNCSIHHNSAFTYGAGLLMTSTSAVVMNGSFVISNEAGEEGGGLHITDSSDITFLSTLVTQNTVGVQGGGAFLSKVQGVRLVDCDIARNVAGNQSGGGIFAESSSLHLTGVSVRANAAPLGGGGGVYWVQRSDMVEPTGLSANANGTNNTFERNVAVYGDNWATESSQIQLGNQSSSVINEYSANPQIIAQLFDYYGQRMSLQTDDDVLSVLSPMETAETDSAGATSLSFCGENTGYLTGAVSVNFKNGMANFSDFMAYCTPGGNLSVAVSHVITSVGMSTRFYAVLLLQFRSCVRGEYYGDRICNKCELGTYSFTTSTDNAELKQSICKPCPENAALCEGDVIHLDPGYWRIHEDTEEILQCPWGEKGCQGGAMVGDDLCATGYEGPLCAVCSDGYHFTRSTQSCEPCEKSSSWLAAYSSLVGMFCVLIICAVLAYFFKSQVMDKENLYSFDDVLVYLAVCLHIIDAKMYYRNKAKLSMYSKQNRRRFNTRVRIYIAFYQIISVVPFVLDLEFPNVYTIVVSFLGTLVNFNVSTSAVVTCSFDSGFDFIDTLYVDILVPVVISCLLKLISMIHLHFKIKKWLRRKTNEDEIKDKANRIRSYYFLIFLLYSYMFLPSLSAEIFQTFSCMDVDEDNVAEGDDSYLRADYSVSCETTRYSVAVIVAAVAVVVYPVGIPSFYFYHLYTNRHLIQTREQACATAAEEKHRLLRLRPLRILFDVYKPQFWYWEVIETIYRLCLTGVLVLINQGSSLQIIMGLLFSLLFIRVYESCCPYEDEILQQIKNISLWQIFFIFGCALLINGDFVDSSNIIVVIFMIFVIFVNFLVDLLRWLIILVKNRNDIGDRFSEMRKRSSSSSAMSSRKSATLPTGGGVVMSPLAAHSPGDVKQRKKTGGNNSSTVVELTSAHVASSDFEIMQKKDETI